MILASTVAGAVLPAIDACLKNKNKADLITGSFCTNAVKSANFGKQTTAVANFKGRPMTEA